MSLPTRKSGWPVSGGRISSRGHRRLGTYKVQQQSTENSGLPSVPKGQGQGQNRKLVRGEILVREGQVGSEDFTVVTGALMLFKSLPGGRRQVVGFRFPGDLLTLRRCDRPWTVTVQALTPATLSSFDCRAARHLADSRRNYGRELLDHASDVIASGQEQVLTLGCKNTEERLATFLLEMLNHAVSGSLQGNAIHLPMSRCVIADYLGLAQETVSRAFGRLADEGLIALPRPSEVAVLDLPALEDLARGNGVPSRKSVRYDSA